MKFKLLIGAGLAALALAGCKSSDVTQGVDLGLSVAREGSCLLSGQAGGVGAGAARICLDLSGPGTPVPVLVPAR